MADQTSARDDVIALFRQFGLDDLFINQIIGVIDGVYQDNVLPTEMDILTSIYASEPYKKRFAGIQMLKDKIAKGEISPGTTIPNPREYLEMEKQYKQIMTDADIPSGFYDSVDDLAKIIASEVSPLEFQNRVNTAKDALQAADQQTVSALKSYYGLSTGDLAAYLLDPTKAVPVFQGRANKFSELNKSYEAAKVGGAALRAGLTADKSMAEEIVQAGKAGQAEDVFSAVAGSQQAYENLSAIWGEQSTKQDLTREAMQLAGGTEVAKKRKRLVQKETAAFSGQSALSAASLSKRAQV